MAKNQQNSIMNMTLST